MHLQTAYFSKIVSLKKEITVNSTEINVYFDPEFNVIQKWQITNQNKTLPLDLYLPLETNKQWLSVIFLHATQGLRMTSQRPIEFYPNYIQRVDMNLSTLRRGKNVSGIQLEVTKNDTMETLIPILYEIRKENGHKIFLKQDLHIVQGNKQGHILEGLTTVENPPDPKYKRPTPTSQLGKNYLKHPTPYELQLYSPRILKILEEMTSKQAVLDDKLPFIINRFSLTTEEQKLLMTNLATLKKNLTRETYVEKQLLNTFLELTKNSQNHFSFVSRPIETLSEIPGTYTTRVFIDIDRSALLRLNIKSGNRVAIETLEGRLSGTLESTGDKTSSFIVEEVPGKIDRQNEVAIMKHDNMFLNLAYFSAINLVRESEHILDYLFLQGPTPQPAFAQHLRFLQPNLTESQREAVSKALTNDGSIPTIITGPAGTGKSLVLAEIGLQVANSNKKVLYISPTIQGVTNLYSTVRKLSERHLQNKIRLLKLSSPAVRIGNDCDQCFRDDLGTNHRYPTLDEIGLRDVIFATPTVALRLGLQTEKQPTFGCVLIDELAYMTETEAVCSLVPFLKKNREENPKVVLASDNRQLTYTPRSQAANLGGMTTDLMTRLMKLEAYSDDRYITPLCRQLQKR